MQSKALGGLGMGKGHYPGGHSKVRIGKFGTNWEGSSETAQQPATLKPRFSGASTLNTPAAEPVKPRAPKDRVPSGFVFKPFRGAKAARRAAYFAQLGFDADHAAELVPKRPVAAKPAAHTKERKGSAEPVKPKHSYDLAAQQW